MERISRRGAALATVAAVVPAAATTGWLGTAQAAACDDYIVMAQAPLDYLHPAQPNHDQQGWAKIKYSSNCNTMQGIVQLNAGLAQGNTASAKLEDREGRRSTCYVAVGSTACATGTLHYCVIASTTGSKSNPLSSYTSNEWEGRAVWNTPPGGC